MLSNTTFYALHALAYIMGNPDTAPHQVHEVAQVTGIPENYLSKILHALVAANILRSTRGPAGGFTTGVAPGDVSIRRVVELFVAPEQLSGVLSPVRTPDAAGRCVIVCWRPVADALSRFLDEQTLADLTV